MRGPDPAVSLRRLAVSFHGREVLRGIDLDVPAGGITVVVGPSGSGKTTLLRAVNRLNDLLPGARTEGEVRVRLGGALRDVREGGLPLEELRRRAAMVFQAPLVLPGSVARNFSVPLRAVFGLGRREVAERAEARLRETGLWEEVRERLRAPAADLSGGQQQRLCLARALALEPDLLLLDEPTANLDARNAALVEGLLLGLRGRVSVLAVSHSEEQARRIGDRVVRLREGRVEGGAPSPLRSPPGSR